MNCEKDLMNESEDDGCFVTQKKIQWKQLWLSSAKQLVQSTFCFHSCALETAHGCLGEKKLGSFLHASSSLKGKKDHVNWARVKSPCPQLMICGWWGRQYWKKTINHGNMWTQNVHNCSSKQGCPQHFNLLLVKPLSRWKQEKSNKHVCWIATDVFPLPGFLIKYADFFIGNCCFHAHKSSVCFLLDSGHYKGVSSWTMLAKCHS